MKALRIKLTQSKANYRKEETVINKMTYPLPPYSTIIGALHNACKYKSYHDMDISVQGKYESMTKQPYTDYCYFNSLQNDRGILVKLRNKSNLSLAFDKVAVAKKPQGNDFEKEITIDVINRELLNEYQYLRQLKRKIDEYNKNIIKPILANIKSKKSNLKNLKKGLDKKSNKYDELTSKENRLSKIEKYIKAKFKDYDKVNLKDKYQKFATINTSLKYYEVLHNIELIIHVKTYEDTLNDILNNIYNIKSLGRSEDFVDITEAKIIELEKAIEEVENKNYGYIPYEYILDDSIGLANDSVGNGTIYYLNKNYKVNNKQRIFKKIKSIYCSNYYTSEDTDEVYIDNDGNHNYIVCFG